MLNALQGGQVLGEFRGISPAERDRLVQAMGDKIRVEESSWTLNLLVVLQRREEAVRRRAGAQGAADGDRPLGRQPGPVEHLDPALGRRRDPPGLAARDAGSRTRQASRASPRTSRSPARKPRSCCRRRASAEPQVHALEPQPRDALHAGRHVPGRPVAADRRRGRAQAVRHRRLSRAHERAATTKSRSTSPTCSWTIPASALPSTCRSRPSAAQPCRAPRMRSSTSSTSSSCASATSRSARRMIRAFEKRAVRAGLPAAAAVVAPHRARPTRR